MSVVFVVTPMVVAGWPLLCGAVAAAAGSLGYKALERQTDVETEKETETEIELGLEDSQIIIADSMSRQSEFSIRRGDVTATFSRAADGRCTVHVSGENKTEAELTSIGQELIGKVTQQYAYNRVVSELKNQGFTVTKAIRIHVSKYV
jgi:hypothetical protein